MYDVSLCEVKCSTSNLVSEAQFSHRWQFSAKSDILFLSPRGNQASAVYKKTTLNCFSPTVVPMEQTSSWWIRFWGQRSLPGGQRIQPLQQPLPIVTRNRKANIAGSFSSIDVSNEVRFAYYSDLAPVLFLAFMNDIHSFNTMSQVNLIKLMHLCKGSEFPSGSLCRLNTRLYQDTQNTLSGTRIQRCLFFNYHHVSK